MTTPPTKAQFLAAYRKRLEHSTAWGEDTAMMDRFMLSVQKSITTEATTWACSGEHLKAVWKELGCKGKPTYKALRALPP